jgi:hypothetical protein
MSKIIRLYNKYCRYKQFYCSGNNCDSCKIKYQCNMLIDDILLVNYKELEEVDYRKLLKELTHSTVYIKGSKRYKGL